MRALAAALVSIGCNNSGPPAPVPTPVPVSVPDAAPRDAPPQPDAARPDASAASAASASSAILITKDGFSTFPHYKRTHMTDLEVTRDLAAKLAPLDVQFAVMDYADDREEGYFSVKHGDREVAQIFRTEYQDGIQVRILGPQFATADGLHTGDTAATLFAKRPKVTCAADVGAELELQCHDSDLMFVLDATGFTAKKSRELTAAEVATRTNLRDRRELVFRASDAGGDVELDHGQLRGTARATSAAVWRRDPRARRQLVVRRGHAARDLDAHGACARGDLFRRRARARDPHDDHLAAREADADRAAIELELGELPREPIARRIAVREANHRVRQRADIRFGDRADGRRDLASRVEQQDAGEAATHAAHRRLLELVVDVHRSSVAPYGTRFRRLFAGKICSHKPNVAAIR